MRALKATAILAGLLVVAIGLSAAGCGAARDDGPGPATGATTAPRLAAPRSSRLSASQAHRLGVATRRFLEETRGFLAPVGHACATLVAKRRLRAASACYDRAYAGVEPAAAGMGVLLDALADRTGQACATSLHRTRVALDRVTRSMSALHRVGESLGEDDGAYGAQIGRVTRQRLQEFRAAAGRSRRSGCVHVPDLP